MSTMLCSVIFTVLVFGYVSAENIYEVHTKGRGNNHVCGYHLCNSDARCEKKTVNNTVVAMCVCQDSKVGNGKLFCKERLDKTIYIQNDPHIYNFANEYASLPSPCRYRVALLHMVSGDRVVTVELFGENLLYKGGHYFLNKIILSTDIRISEYRLQQTMEFYGDVTRGGQYTLYARSVQADGLSIASDENIFNIQDGGNFSDFSINVDKDEVNNLLKANIDNLGITLLFRPPTSDVKLNNFYIPMVPGAVLNIKYDHWNMVSIDNSDIEISSWPQGPSLKEVASNKGLSKNHLVQYLMLNNTLSMPAYTDYICLENARLFREECSTEELKHKMLQVCTPLYTNELLLETFYHETQKALFQQCEKAVCRRDKQECETLKETLKKEFPFGLPTFYENLDCDHVTEDATAAY